MAVFECKCGFSSTSSAGFKRHVTRNNKEAPNMHGQACKEDTDSEEVTPPAKSVLSPKQSYFSSFFSSPTKQGKGAKRSTAAAAETHCANSAAQSGDLDRSSCDTCSEDVDAAWEAVAAETDLNDADAPYADITRTLKAAPEQRRLSSRYIDISDDEEPHGGVAAAVTKSLRAMRDAAVVASHATWRTSIDGCEPAHQEEVALEAGQFPVEAVEAVLLWVDPWLSLKVGGAGLYLLICLRHLVCGVELVQPSTILAGAALGALVWRITSRYYTQIKAARPGKRRTVPSVGRPTQQEQQQQQAAAAGGGDSWAAQQVDLQRRISHRVTKAAAGVAPVIAAVCALVVRRLSEHDKIASVWLALALWSVMLLGEMRLLSQPSLAILLWLALFSLPWLYLQCRRALDSLLEEIARFVASIVLGGERATLLLCAGTSIFAVGITGGTLLTRVSVAVVAAGGVLIWRSMQAAACRATARMAAAA